MPADSSIWVQWAQPAATFVLGIGAALLAYRQSQTARDKLVLDLYQQRLRVYNAVLSPLSKVLSAGLQGATDQVRADFLQAVIDARFLFGPEVRDLLDKMRQTLGVASRTNKRMKARREEHIEEELFDLEEKCFKEIEDFCTSFSEMMDSYIKMDHKLSSAKSLRRQNLELWFRRVRLNLGLKAFAIWTRLLRHLREKWQDDKAPL